MNEKSVKFDRFLKRESSLKTKIKVFGEAKFSRILPFIINQKMMLSLDLDPSYTIEACRLQTQEIADEVEFTNDMGINEESFQRAYNDYLKSFLR